MRVIDRYLIPILVAAVMLTSVALVGCSQSQEPKATPVEDKASWTEKQVIEYLYEYLMHKAGQLQGARAEGEKVIIDWGFGNVIMEANREVLEEDDLSKLGEWVEMEFNEPLGTLQEPSRTPAWTGALKRLATYEGNGWWSISIGDWEWRVNEAGKEVVTWNGEAAKLLEEISLKTYHNSRYGYYLNYPPSWKANDEDKSKVWILSGSPKASEAFIFIHVVEEGELDAFKGLEGYIVAKLILLQNLCYEFELIEKTTTRIDYIYRLQKDSPRHEAKRRFMRHESRVYEIVCSAELTAFGEYYSLSLIYDPFDSFRFQP